MRFNSTGTTLEIPRSLQIPRCGKWLPEDTDVLRAWLRRLILEVEKAPKEWHPVIRDFQELIEGDPVIFMQISRMFQEVPRKYLTTSMRSTDHQVRNYRHMLSLFDRILTQAPDFSEDGILGFPIGAILNWPMATPSGMAVFVNNKVNQQLKKMLDVWAEHLSSPASKNVLNTGPAGWLGPQALAAMTAPNERCFCRTFVCNPQEPHWGFKSWDDFFTRRLRLGVRPIADMNDDNVIINACESAPHKIARHVKKIDKFWIKAQPYSLHHMLAHDPLAEHFIGGTIYQSFLSATTYHRWHSPINGRIVKAWVQPGSYYSEAPCTGFSSPSGRPDPEGPNESQAYITAVATRAIIFIEADNPHIGLTCVLPVGMAEVSTCDVTVRVGQHVKKGDELGMFHYGGSTCCLLFRKEVKLDFDLHGQSEKDIGLNAQNIHVNARIATLK